MQRGDPSSFDRIFGRNQGGGDETPSVHELFSAVMRDQLSLQEFAKLLVQMHGVRLTPAAVRLLSSVDASSGQVSFSQFQRTMQQEGDAAGGAGKPNVFTDHAKAIITDNTGAPEAPPTHAAPAKHSTDISIDPFVKQSQRIEHAQAKGSFQSNPVVRTNRASVGNPMAMCAEPAQRPQDSEDPYGAREMANTATRMYVTNELDRKGYEQFLDRFGIKLKAESELHRLILAHEKVGDGKFANFSRALQREMAEALPG